MRLLLKFKGFKRMVISSTFICLVAVSNFSYAQAPNCAALISPGNGSTSISIMGTSLTWAAPSTGTPPNSYEVYLGTNPAADNIVNGINVGNVLTYSPGTLSCNTTYYWKVRSKNALGTASGCTTYSFTTGTPGNPAVFGNSEWIAYSFADEDFTNYRGFYTETNLSFNSSDKFAQSSTPSSAPGYQGCAVPSEHHSISYKRQGFTSGTYQISIPYHDDNCTLLINGNTVFAHNGCCDQHNSVWVGNLSPTSTVEFKWKEITGLSEARLTLTQIPTPTLNSGSIAASQNMCSGNDPIAFNSLSPASGGCTFGIYQWQQSSDGVNYSNIAGATSLTYNVPAGITQTTYYRRAASDACQIVFTAPVSVLVHNSAPGNPSVFGENLWNAYAFMDENFTNYAGYYTETTLNFNSASKFPTNLSPSTPTYVVAGYQGCQIPTDHHSLIYKRRGFPEDIYQINLPEHDDHCFLFINGVQIFSHLGYGDSHDAVWIGLLNSTSTVEFRWKEITGNSWGQMEFVPTIPTTLNAGIVSGNQSICSGDDPLAFTSSSLPSGGCYINSYQWQSSTDNITFANIPGATGITYNAPSVTQTTYFRRAAIDACNVTGYSNTLTVSIYATAQGDPSVFGNNQWRAYAYRNNDFTNYGGFYTATGLNFNSRDAWNDQVSPFTPDFKTNGYVGCQIPINNHSIIYKRRGFEEGMYEIDINSHDDEASLYINGVLIYTHVGCCDSHDNIWVGNLNATSTVEFRWRETGGASHGALSLTLNTTLFIPSGGTIAGDQSICSGDNPTAFTNTESPSGGCTITGLQWQSSLDNVNFTNIPGATDITYDATSVSQTTYFRRLAFDACETVRYSNKIAVNIYATPPGNPAEFGDNQWKVYAYKNNNFSNYGGFYTQTGLSFNSQSRWGAGESPFTPSFKATGYQGCQIPFDNHSIIYKRRGFPVGTYRIDITGHDDDATLYIDGVLILSHAGCCDTHNNVWTGTLNASSTVEFRWRDFTGGSYGAVTFTSTTPSTSVAPGAISGNQLICNNPADPAAFASTTDASSTCHIYYQWQSSSDNTTYADISGATSASYDVPAGLTTTTYFRRKVIDACGNTANTSSVLVTVYNAFVAGSISADQTICYNTVPTTITNVGLPTGGTGTYTYQWQSSPNNSTWSNISDATSTSYSPSSLTASTYFRRVETSGSCGTTYTNTVTITVRPNLTAGAIGTSHSICYNGTASTLTNAASAAGGNNSFSYQWERSTDNVSWTAIAGATVRTYAPGQLTTSTYFRRVVSSGTSCPAVTTPVLVTVNPNVTVSVSISASATTICAGTSVTFTASTTTGGTSPSYLWQVNGSNVGSGPTYTSSTLADESSVRCIMTSNHPCINGGSSAVSNTITMKVYSGAGVWTGAVNSNWDNAGNWCGGVPTIITDAVINAGVPNMPIVNTYSYCRNLTVGNGATLTIDGSNTLQIHGTWSHNGTFIPNTGTINYASNATQTIISRNYYNLQSSSTGNRILSPTGLIRIAGSFIPGTNNYTITGSSVDFNGGDYQQIAPFTYNNLSTWGLETKILSGNVTVNGQVNSPALSINGHTLVLNGYVTLNTRFKGTETSNLVLGTTATLEESLSFYNSHQVLNNLTIYRTGDIVLGSPLIINGILRFPSSGLIMTSSSNLLTLNRQASFTGNSAFSFISGPLSKVMEEASQFIFPIGKPGYERKASVLPETNATTTYTAEYFHSDPTAMSEQIENPPLDHISSVEYWMINKSGPAKAKVELFWGSESNVGSELNDLRVAHYNSGTDIWENKDGEIVMGSTSNYGSIRTPEFLESFSPFTLATISPTGPLPVSYLYFNVVEKNNKALLNWKTTNEINNSGFVIERSVAGSDNFDSAGFVKATDLIGGENDYAFEDKYYDGRLTYYRLKQVDFNGEFSYSVIRELRSKKSISLGIYPNPTRGKVTVKLRLEGEVGTLKYTVISLQGILLHAGKADGEKQLEEELAEKLTGLKSGVYLLRISSLQEDVTIKVIKE